MKALQAEALASIDDYREVDLPVPEPAAGQARINVAACGVGYVDALVSLGRYQVKPPLPHIPGGEVGGTVDAIGPGVERLKIGQRVMAQVGGGFAEYALAPAAGVVPIPEPMSFEQAAGFRINYLTALHGLRDRAVIAPGERLLVIGAAGGVGTAAVQVGRALGAEVIAAASSEEKRAFALAHGASAVIDTAPEGWRDRLKTLTGGKGVDVVFDPVCGPLFEPAFRQLAWRGRHLVVGFAGGPIPALPANLPLMKGAGLIGVDVRQFGLFEPGRMADRLSELLAWVADGRLVPPVGRVFSFAEAAEALSFALSGAGTGKTILKLG
ncbi:MAG: NADPH:quinone oxidoreductase family protein [Caulobacteraceae bacterium]|nr:NADPH:quinone oxidoreductase family protein [Caulobacteraceae bacterium]